MASPDEVGRRDGETWGGLGAEMEERLKALEETRKTCEGVDKIETPEEREAREAKEFEERKSHRDNLDTLNAVSILLQEARTRKLTPDQVKRLADRAHGLLDELLSQSTPTFVQVDEDLDHSNPFYPTSMR